ncbi:MAG: ABC transporter permease [Caldilineaceae bacterium SB0661_bin_32]|uniref:ABC transporter permease n=1 Tax=Caldilineaceae bacterium SB0661_bin_32 TaxID=2605255 RepID=A0A6B1DB76_9CHLR|nr:ABC transporter permease [Caldilineaceae bacterium SB0661_bin_32]
MGKSLEVATSKEQIGPVAEELPRRSERSRAWRRYKANRMAVIAGAFIILLCLMAIFADTIVPHDPLEIYSGKRGVGPSSEHLMGFDHVGRDLFSRVIYGSRVALIVGLGASSIAVIIGVMVGVTAGYFSGWPDSLLSRLTDTLMAFPIIALLILLASIVGPSLVTTVVVIGVTSWAIYARVVRAQVLSLKRQEFVVAALAIGASDRRIIFRHILPNVLAPVIVLVTLGVGTIIILEAALSFLGLGIQPPTPSWGGTLSDGRAFILLFPHIAMAPGIMIVLTVLAFNLLGDGLRDALDPRQKDIT